MATFVTLVNFTDQGIRNVKDSPTRFESFKALVEAQGGAVKSAYYTQGNYDMVVIVEGDEDAVVEIELRDLPGILGGNDRQKFGSFDYAAFDEVMAVNTRAPIKMVEGAISSLKTKC